jgi:hypothetical protein
VYKRQGKPKPLVSLDAALAVEWYRGDLYASTMAPTDVDFNPTDTGSVVKIHLHD